MLFGEYLLLRCLVDEETLLEALGDQVRDRPFLGELAVREGYMSPWDVYRVINKQRNTRRYFGDIAIEMGLVSEEEMDDLIQLQAKATLPLGEVLVKKGTLTREGLDQLLADFDELKKKREDDGRAA